jgi:hypothetical protein
MIYFSFLAGKDYPRSFSFIIPVHLYSHGMCESLFKSQACQYVWDKKEHDILSMLITREIPKPLIMIRGMGGTWVLILSIVSHRDHRDLI